MTFDLGLLAGNAKLLRFLEKIALVESGCWEWQDHLSRDGYGFMTLPGRGRKHPAHRVAYELFLGPIPAGHQIDHLCRRTRCVNPEHLEAVTPRVNVLRGDTFAARQAAQTHCKHGHELSGSNLYEHPNGSRQCRTCRTVRNREWSRRKRATSPARYRIR